MENRTPCNKGQQRSNYRFSIMSCRILRHCAHGTMYIVSFHREKREETIVNESDDFSLRFLYEAVRVITCTYTEKIIPLV